MDKEIVIRLHSRFEAMVQRFPGTETEFWCARDLQLLLGYAQWKNLAKVIDKAITACQTAGYDLKDHFADISKMVDLGSGASTDQISGNPGEGGHKRSAAASPRAKRKMDAQAPVRYDNGKK